NAKSALSWRYPTRTPARVRITSTPTAGRATAASVASETATGRSGRAGGRNDRTPIGMAPLDAGGAIPGSDVVVPKVVRPSVATPVFLLLSGLPGRCCSVGSCGCGGGVTIAAGLLATGTWLHPGDAVDATAVRPFFLVSAATTLVTGAAAVGAGAAAVAQEGTPTLSWAKVPIVFRRGCQPPSSMSGMRYRNPLLASVVESRASTLRGSCVWTGQALRQKFGNRGACDCVLFPVLALSGPTVFRLLHHDDMLVIDADKHAS